MMDFLRKLHRKWIKPWDRGESPMEVRRAILDEIEAKVVTFGGGRKIFPFDRLTIHILAAEPEQRVVLESAIQEGWNLEDSVRDTLERIGCEVPQALRLDYDFSNEGEARFGDRRFFVEYDQAQRARMSSMRPSLRLEVTHGQALEPDYVTSASRVHIGRLPEVFDRHGRLERRNDVAFSDEGEINATVSRKHASIRYDKESRAFYLRDNSSATGTSIFRDGRSIRVGSHRKGVRIHDGDQLILGRAQLAARILGAG